MAFLLPKRLQSLSHRGNTPAIKHWACVCDSGFFCAGLQRNKWGRERQHRGCESVIWWLRHTSAMAETGVLVLPLKLVSLLYLGVFNIVLVSWLSLSPQFFKTVRLGDRDITKSKKW